MQIELGDITAELVLKSIKNVHLSVYPPAGKVRITAPLRMSIETIRVFAVSKIAWIKKQQQRLRTQEREPPREYLDRESHYLWGKRYLLEVRKSESAPEVMLQQGKIILQVRPKSTMRKRKEILDEWYREQIRRAVPLLLAKWEPTVGVKVDRIFVRQMKTRWGTCNPGRRSIRLNTDLAKKPPECLEYIIVHEMAHIIEHRHGSRFKALMDRHLPSWRHIKRELNTAPLVHLDREY